MHPLPGGRRYNGSTYKYTKKMCIYFKEFHRPSSFPIKSIVELQVKEFLGFNYYLYVNDPQISVSYIKHFLCNRTTIKLLTDNSTWMPPWPSENSRYPKPNPIFLLKPVLLLGDNTYGKENIIFEQNRPKFKYSSGSFSNTLNFFVL